MGNSPKFCTSLLRDLSSRKALGRVLSATVLGRADTEAELSGPELAEAVSKVISEKRGEVTVETNLLSGDALAAVVKEYARELSEEIDGSEASELVGFADFKKELIPGFTDSDALAESMVGRIVPGTPEFAKAMLFFAGRFLVSKNRVSQYNGSEGTIQ